MPEIDKPIHGLTLGRGGNLKPYYNPRGNGLGDIRHVSGEFFLSVKKLWRERGDETLQRVADEYPELVFAGMVKLCQITKVEVGGPLGMQKICRTRHWNGSWTITLSHASSATT